MNDDHYLTRLQSIVSSVARQGAVTVFGHVPEQTLDALRKYGIRIAPASETIGSTVLAFSYVDTSGDGVSAFFDRIDGAANVVVFGRLAADKDILEAAAFAKGYRYHPAYFGHVEYDDRFDDGYWSVLEKVPNTVDTILGGDATREPGVASYARMARYAFIGRFIRPGDRVLDSRSGTGYGANIIRTLSECAAVVGRSAGQLETAYACANFRQSGLKFESGDPLNIADHPAEVFDAVVSFAASEHVGDVEKMVAEAARLLRPGGRLILGVDLGTRTALELVADVRQTLEIEGLWVQNSASRTISKAPADGRSLDGDSLLIVAYRSPVADATGFRDTIYSYPDPTKNFLSFARDYKNPLLMRTLFGIGVRVSSAEGRDHIARTTLSESPPSSADRGAALCVIGYRLLEVGNTSDIRAFVEEALAFGKGDALSPHAFRWSVSLTFLAGVMEQRLGNHERAIACFDRVMGSDWLGFSPTLGTKAAEAAYRAGLIKLGENDLRAARGYWSKGMDVAKRIMSVDWAEIVGDEECPLPDSMRESIMALEIARKCGDCLRLTSEHEYRSDYAAWRAMIDDPSMAASRNLAVMQAAKSAGSDAAKWRKLRSRLKSNQVVSKLIGALGRLRRRVAS